MKCVSRAELDHRIGPGGQGQGEEDRQTNWNILDWCHTETDKADAKFAWEFCTV